MGGNNHFSSNLLTIKLSCEKSISNFMFNFFDPIEAAISKYKNHRSLKAIWGRMSKLDNPVFSFDHTSLGQTLVKLKKLNPKKASQVCLLYLLNIYNIKDIPVKIFKKLKTFCLFHISSLQNLIAKFHFSHYFITGQCQTCFHKRWQNR